MLLDPYQFQSVKLVDVVRESAEAVSVRLEPPVDYSFLSGQHAVVRVTVNGTQYTRQYSFSSAPQSGELWLTIVKTPGGVVSNWFVETATAGDSIEISRPYSGPLMQKLTRGKQCMIAGGSGIAPLMSIVRDNRLLAHPQAISLLYSTRTNRRCFAHELAPLDHETIVVRLSDTEGRFSEEDVLQAINGCASVYVCGSREFVEFVRLVCKKLPVQCPVFSEAFTL